jgi:hypothetical protein
MRIILLSPPPLKPSEPGLSAPAAAQVLRQLGVQAESLDTAIAWQNFALTPVRLEAALAAIAGEKRARAAVPAFRRAIAALRKTPPPLRCGVTYNSRRTYSSAINHIENGLHLAAAAFPDVQLGIANLTSSRAHPRPESSEWLERFSRSAGPFDAYFAEELLPQLRARHATHVGVSLTFREQAPAGFRLARLLADELPSVVRLVGGPFVACLDATDVRFDRSPFTLFHRVIAGSES